MSIVAAVRDLQFLFTRLNMDPTSQSESDHSEMEGISSSDTFPTTKYEEVQPTNASKQVTPLDEESGATLVPTTKSSANMAGCTQSLTHAGLSSPVPSFMDQSISGTKQYKKRGRKASLIPSHDSISRSTSRQRKHSKDDTGLLKRPKKNGSSGHRKSKHTSDPAINRRDAKTMAYLDKLVDTFTSAIAEKLDQTRDEQNEKLDTIEKEVKELRSDLSARMAVVERQI